MPKNAAIDIRDLKLDLRNYRTVAQSKETHAIQAMISVSPDRFWALTESLLEDGYLPTENVIVSKAAGADAEHVVREGNRRIAALKLIHGLFPKGGIAVPSYIAEKIKAISDDWKKANQAVPCVVYGPKEAAVVDRIVTLTHGKGDKASREDWKAIARARHNRDVNKASEPGLDLLEKYLKSARNLSKEQSDNWSGTYPISVLDEAIKRLAPRLGLSNAPELAKKYPKIGHRDALDAIIKDIGEAVIKFETLRGSSRDFASPYGIPVPAVNEPAAKPGAKQDDISGKAGGSTGHASGSNGHQGAGSGGAGATASGGDSGANGKGSAAAATGTSKKTAAVSINDPKAVMRTLRKFSPLGLNREKVVALKKEMLTLKLEKAPMAFCFLLRSSFEISAKVYCDDHKSSGGPSLKDKSGKDRTLVDVLRDVVNHLTNNKADKDTVKALHGAITELAKSEGILSVTSMNQLVHNQKFSVQAGDIAGLFGNVFPLLEAMNS
ncbi:MAG: hypothetical protein LBL59_10155 [Xanthomonadaceae bacterium]|nr:hypothetical protein [Xanthomonadaceae bacterium]